MPQNFLKKMNIIQNSRQTCVFSPKLILFRLMLTKKEKTNFDKKYFLLHHKLVEEFQKSHWFPNTQVELPTYNS